MPYLELRDGVPLYYEEHGEGRAIVLVPGWTLTTRFWQLSNGGRKAAFPTILARGSWRQPSIAQLITFAATRNWEFTGKPRGKKSSARSRSESSLAPLREEQRPRMSVALIPARHAWTPPDLPL